MQTYIALLRGINVSGQKKIKMADLREHLAELPFQDIQTYIQSGNILFRAAASKPAQLAVRIREKILEKYGFEVPTLVVTASYISTVLANNPFRDDPEIPDERIYLTFLAESPQAEYLKKLDEVDYSPEQFHLQNQVIYFYSPNSYGRAKMNNNFFEKKLKVAATTRNWRTSQKLIDMAGEMEA